MRVNPTSDEIRAALGRLLDAPRFRRAPNLSAFLRFTVERTLSGEAESLKESTLAVEVFGRAPSYNPREDAIVRVQAGRLRARLAEYYAAEGIGDAVRVAYDKGSYVPRFLVEQEHVPRARKWWWVAAAAAVVIGALALAGIRPRPDNESRQLYVKARYHFGKRTAAGLERSAQLFEEAIRRDPSYAAAHAGLANVLGVLGGSGHLSESDAFPRAKAAALRALAIDAGSAEGHGALAYALLYYDWKPSAAAVEFRRAVRLAPADATLQHWYSECLTALGEGDQAVAAARRAVELDAASAIVNAGLGRALYYSRRYVEAEAQLRAALDLEPNLPAARGWLGWSLLGQGRAADALAEYQRAIAAGNRGVILLASTAWAARSAGNPQAEADAVRMLGHKGEGAALGWALVAAASGDSDRAFHYLEAAVRMRASGIVMLAVHPIFERLHADARFPGLFEKIQTVALVTGP